MSARFDQSRMNEDARLAAALRLLPQQSPPADLFPLVAARARRRARNRRALRYLVPAAALAASVVLAVSWPRMATHGRAAVASSNAAHAGPAPAQIASLRKHSQALQDWVHELDAGGAPLNAAALADASEIEDRIALVDLQLGAGGDAATQSSLWHQRIALLEQLGMLRLSSTALAATPDARARPAVWID
jgi:hypothetical protein